MSLPILASMLLSFSVLMVFIGLMSLRPRSDLQERIELYSGGLGTAGAPASLEQLELEESFTKRVIVPLVLRGAEVTGRLLPNKRLAKLRERLVLAGEPGGLTPAHFYGIKIWLTIIASGLAWLRLHFGPPPTMMLLLELGVFVFAGFKLPDIWLSRRIKQRQLELTNALPDALDMLTIAVEAGLSFDQGLGEIVARWNNELSREFQRVLYEIGMGTSRREALAHLRERTGVSDIATFVVAINHAEEMGTSIGQVLNVQSVEMRTRRRLRAQEKANKVPVKMMFPLVFFIFPAMFAVILGPAIPRISRALGGLH